MISIIIIIPDNVAYFIYLMANCTLELSLSVYLFKGVTIWNELSTKVSKNCSFNAFKINLKEHLLSS